MLPRPVPGLVVCYAYLWRDEALRGRQEGRKDRPCVIVLSVEDRDGQTIVTVAPVTHAPPRYPDSAVEIPAATKARLGLDGDRSWIVAADLNRFVWPGVDLRPIRRGSGTYAYGLLPDALYRRLKDRVLRLARSGRLAQTFRND
ncbi:type II toxin-antitoxin system PemK/MazF family toxin [Brevundimonas sp. AJA228-03]|uniref:type II toxin-antitoxin system PemK/MazF family toxin n=1 Tax=Brevundimonas sp. AJA228-03 TaxID=2752515 RepID=UPI001FD7A703|nr:type II toxin-antitoxin system PemK/MazF family toxin [Brevundimonas sp. AJA228-03]